MSAGQDNAVETPSFKNPFTELKESFGAVRHLDRRFWVPNLVFLLDGAAYFGILNILTLHLGGTVGLGDRTSGLLVSYLTGALTLFTAIFGGFADRLGVRRTMTLTIVASLVGRIVLGFAPALPLPLVWVVVSMTSIAFGAGLLQTATYAAVKQSTDERTTAVGFSLVYSLMNAGIVLESLASSLVRERWGTTGVIWMCTGITALYLYVHLAFFPKHAGAPVAQAPTGLGEVATEEPPSSSKGTGWRSHPLANPRFLFFIFVLLGVRTLFAHQWLTMPDYVTRAYPAEVGARFEWINGLNPLIIFIGTPLVAALTRKVHVLTMMIVGTSVSALSTFLLVPGPNLGALLTYVIIFSIGEALWSSRFLEYIADVAPPERVGVYMGVATVPWFLAKFTTGFYSGAMLERFVPASGAHDTTTMWLVYAVIALTSPVGLLLGRRWLQRGIAGSASRPASASSASA